MVEVQDIYKALFSCYTWTFADTHLQFMCFMYPLMPRYSIIYASVARAKK